MDRVKDWNDVDISVARSAGGVLATASPWDNVIRTGIAPWPPVELLQKVYQSRHATAFRDGQHAIATGSLGFYSDLQSLRSEDAITWSVFGPLVNADQATKRSFARALFQLIDVDAGRLDAVSVWLWRRLPHPDTLVSGGPEIDFGIQSDEVLLLGEAKWLSVVRTRQGAAGDKDQLTLRREFCQKYGPRLLAGCRTFVVLGVSPDGGLLSRADSNADGIRLHSRDTTWEAVCRLPEHPLNDELIRYLRWKRQHPSAAVGEHFP